MKRLLGYRVIEKTAAPGRDALWLVKLTTPQPGDLSGVWLGYGIIRGEAGVMSLYQSEDSARDSRLWSLG